ncbi:MAG: hypothetical protein WCA32_19400 [Chromatiaceae bacterium]|jgi:hypothetical protein
MTTILPSPRTLTSSLTVQIGEAERRLQNRRRLVGVRGVALRRALHQWMTDPTVLLWAGGMGFLIGELTQRHTPKPQGSDPSPNPGHPFFDSARTVMTLVTLARPLFSMLPGAKTQHPSASDAAAQAPAPPERTRATPSGDADEGRGDPVI